MKKLIPEARKSLKILLILNATLLFLSLIYLLIFSKNPDAFDCIVKRTFSFYCPACGGSRALRELFHFNLINSFILYPPLIISALVIFAYDTRLLLAVVKNTEKYTKDYKFYSFILIPVSIILNFLVRNALLLFGVDYIGDVLCAYNFSLV